MEEDSYHHLRTLQHLPDTVFLYGFSVTLFSPPEQ